MIIGSRFKPVVLSDTHHQAHPPTYHFFRWTTCNMGNCLIDTHINEQYDMGI